MDKKFLWEKIQTFFQELWKKISAFAAEHTLLTDAYQAWRDWIKKLPLPRPKIFKKQLSNSPVCRSAFDSCWTVGWSHPLVRAFT